MVRNMLTALLPKEKAREISKRILEERNVELRKRLAKTAENITFEEE